MIFLPERSAPMMYLPSRVFSRQRSSTLAGSLLTQYVRRNTVIQSLNVLAHPYIEIHRLFEPS